jgi:hypothetical protein
MTEEQIKTAAEKQADETMDCNCDPHHYFYECHPCWYHMESREQFILSFSYGVRYALAELEKKEIS